MSAPTRISPSRAGVDQYVASAPHTAWISGAASGMGEGIARLFAREGAAVALVDVQAGKGSAVAEQIRAEGGRAIFIECDVAKEAAVRASIERTEKEFGGLHIIVNCAGIVQINC